MNPAFAVAGPIWIEHSPASYIVIHFWTNVKEGKLIQITSQMKGTLSASYVICCGYPGCSKHMAFGVTVNQSRAFAEAANAGWKQTKWGWTCPGCREWEDTIRMDEVESDPA